MSDGAEIDFRIEDLPGSHFYELLIAFDGQIVETSGSRGTGQIPEDLILQAVLRILLGDRQAYVWLDATPGLTKLTFSQVQRDGPWVSPMTAEGLQTIGCQISKTECDERTGDPIADTEVLGVALSAVQMARAAFFMAHEAYGSTLAHAQPPVSLIALEALLNALDGVGRA